MSSTNRPKKRLHLNVVNQLVPLINPLLVFFRGTPNNRKLNSAIDFCIIYKRSFCCWSLELRSFGLCLFIQTMKRHNSYMIWIKRQPRSGDFTTSCWGCFFSWCGDWRRKKTRLLSLNHLGNMIAIIFRTGERKRVTNKPSDVLLGGGESGEKERCVRSSDPVFPPHTHPARKANTTTTDSQRKRTVGYYQTRPNHIFY